MTVGSDASYYLFIIGFDHEMSKESIENCCGYNASSIPEPTQKSLWFGDTLYFLIVLVFSQ